MVSPRKLSICLTLLALGASGCGQSTTDGTAYWHGRGWGAAALAISVSGGSDTPTPSGACINCNGEGWIFARDTGRKIDCPDCDKNPPLPRSEAPLSPVPPPPEPPVEPAPELVWYDDYNASMQDGEVSGRKVVVLFRVEGGDDDAVDFTAAALKQYLAGDGRADWVGVVKVVTPQWAKDNGSPTFALLEPARESKGKTSEPKVLTSGVKDAATILRLMKELR